jgi:predicted RNA-binding protein with RPS1 domain
LGEEIEVKILRVDAEARKIGLSLRRVQWAAEEQASESVHKPTPVDVQTASSDINMSQIEESQEKTGNPEQVISSLGQPNEQNIETIERGVGDTGQVKEIEETEQAGGDSNEEEKADN